MLNRLKSLNSQFKKILKISSQIAEDHQCRIYLVGGVVRDSLLGKPVFDLDIVVEADAIVFCERLAKYLGKKFRRHHSFGTATLYYDSYKIDFATARTEKYSSPGVLPKVKAASLKEDLFRRDFTINAMAISLNQKDYGRLLDFYGGLGDLRKGLIRVMHPESFLDDSLRLLRAIRFEQRFFFKIEKKTNILMQQAIAAGALSWVNPHRLRQEIVLLLAEPQPYRCIKRMYLLEKFNFIEPNLVLTKEDFNFFIRIQRAINYYDEKVGQRRLKSWLIFLAGILIKLPRDKVIQIINRFGFKKGERLIIISIKEGLGKVKQLDKKVKPNQAYRALHNYSYEALLFFYAYFTQKLLRKNIRFFLEKLAIVNLKVRGKDLERIGLESSLLMGEVLKELLYLNLDRGFKTKKEELQAAKKIIEKLRKG